MTIVIGNPVLRASTGGGSNYTGPKVNLYNGTIEDSSTLLLLHGEGSNGSTSITDSSNAGISLTAYGTAAISTSRSKVGSSSILLDSSSGCRIQGTSPTNILSSGDFTFEAWIYPTALAGNAGYSDWGTAILSLNDASNSAGLIFNMSTDGKILLSKGQVGDLARSNSTVSLNTWTHVAIVRSGNTHKFFLNGVLDNTVSRTADGSIGTTYTVSGYSNAANTTIGRFIGNIDELRLSTVARYSSNFTPSTTPFVGAPDYTLLTPTAVDDTYFTTDGKAYRCTSLSPPTYVRYGTL